jgi:hypothetical protein
MNAYRFIAYSTITGRPIAHASTASAALLETDARNWPHCVYLEILDCGEEGPAIWTLRCFVNHPVPLDRARERHISVFQGECAARFQNEVAA